ncbi:hypothetical protein ACIA8E_41045 [Streptomyces sp. NPDC051664]|uniref:hypothetical protein n=1 Tax=Streptomyces sp. NPDC051664 TaxID=3365668 RepID=UPI0037A5AB28
MLTAAYRADPCGRLGTPPRRSHRALDLRPPADDPHVIPFLAQRIQRRDNLGGLIHEYRLGAVTAADGGLELASDEGGLHVWWRRIFAERGIVSRTELNAVLADGLGASVSTG